METLTKELWKEIPGFKGYEISNYGNVKSYKNRHGLKDKPHKISTKIEKSRYSKISLMLNGVRVSKSLHVLVLETHKTLRPKGMVCCHNDGDMRNNHIDNLRWDTVKNNCADKWLHGTEQIGERIGTSKLKEVNIPEIRRLRSEKKLTHREISKKYNVSPQTIWHVLKGNTWSHVK